MRCLLLVIGLAVFVGACADDPTPVRNLVGEDVPPALAGDADGDADVVPPRGSPDAGWVGEDASPEDVVVADVMDVPLALDDGSTGPADPGAASDAGVAPDVPAPPQSWTLAVLPDTQYYARDFPWVFEAQTQWLADNAQAEGIRFVVHEGDLTQDNVADQWAVVRGALDTLVDAQVPFAIAPGNHDYGPSGDASVRDSQLDLFFGPADYAATPEVLLFEEQSVHNSAHVFEAGGQEIVVLALEFAPRAAVVAWASGVIGARPDARIILTTHAYLYHDSTRYDWGLKGPTQQWSPYSYGLADEDDLHDGAQLWDDLVRGHPGFAFTLNGHVLGDGLGHLVSLGDHGNVVHQILANYQQGVTPPRPEGGGGFLRLMRFEPDQTVHVRTYSPYLDQWLTDPANDFVVSLDASDYDYLAGASSFGHVTFEDDPQNATLIDCDPGPITSPGADIDAALLFDEAQETIGTLSSCALVMAASCDNDNAQAAEAHGIPDAPGTEAGGGYVSLNGGALSCGWSQGASIEAGTGQSIEVHEIGKSVENYRVRLCVDPEAPLSCTTVTSYGTGIQLIPVDAVFF